MKMKKLLAGVLSAAMVATMIPASMAFSSVSAEGTNEDSFVAYYDFTAGETEGWASYISNDMGATWTTGNGNIVADASGITFKTAGANAYSIENPLKGVVEDGFTISVNYTIPAEQASAAFGLTSYESVFGFNNHTAWQYWQLSNDGTSIRSNSDNAYKAWTGTTENPADFYFDLAGFIATSYDIPCQSTISVDSTGVRIYLNGELKQTWTNDDDGVLTDVTLGAADSLDFFNLGMNASGGTWNWVNSMMTVKDVAFYNSALSSEQVASLNPEADREAYAKSIADTLNITMRGRQAGTIDGEIAVRFVANLDQDAINDNEAVTKLGWAAEDGTAVTESADGYMLNTVTSDSNLAATGKYAYTYVQATEDSVAVLPCVQITVNGNAYWFAYDGISGSAVSTEASAVVSAIDVEGVFAAAAENTLA